MEKIYFPRILEEISNKEAITILELHWFYFENSLIIYIKVWDPFVENPSKLFRSQIKYSN